MSLGIGVPFQYLDVGIPIIFPCWSEATYWENYWEAKHKEQSKYGGKCKAKWNKGEPHVMGKKPPAPEDCTFNKTFKWIGSY